MTITPVDSKNDLFFVEEIYPKNLIDSLSKIDHFQSSWTTENLQEWVGRRKLKNSHNIVYQNIDKTVKGLCKEINFLVNLQAFSCNTVLWLDMPTFEMNKHLDNDGVYAAMQIYLSKNSKPMPTVFYNSDGSVRFEPEYRINSGYLMLNNKNQWHAMPFTVPKDEYRLTSYTWFWRNE